MSNFTDHTGKRFGKLVVLGLHGKRDKQGRMRWNCLCDCGRSKLILASNLASGRSQSCGCTHGGWNRSHEMTMTLEYKTWQNMKDRCYNDNNPDFHYYGGRGISVCQEWRMSFETFYRDMGPKPNENMSLDRIDNNGNYETSNCRWATQSQQVSNRRNLRAVV
jgi:hypothetical protein